MLRILLFVFHFSTPSFALEIYQRGDSQWTHFYQEDKKWVVERISVDMDGWPKLESREVFFQPQPARIAIKSEREQALLLAQLPENEKELKGENRQSLWKVTQEWTWEWEVKYAQWIKKELHRKWWADFGLATDCADVAYSAKWIFARMHGLPMANRLASGHWFTHNSVKPAWKDLPTAKEWHKDKKFLVALNYMLDFVYTHSLWRDSYPVAITPQSFLPGVHHLSLFEDSGHTQFVHQVGTQSDEVPVLTLNSTVPRAKRELAEFIFFSGPADVKGNGFQRMRWPQWKNGNPGLVDAEKMPFYSDEQFEADFIRSPRKHFWEEVFFRLNPAADFDLVAQKTAHQLIELFQQRKKIVEDGYQFCSRQPCREGSVSWEAWSTPSRDTRIKSFIQVLQNLWRYVRHPESVNKILLTPVLTQEGYTFAAHMLILGFNKNLFSSDPNETPLMRWGVHPRAVGEKMRRLYQEGLVLREQQVNAAHSCKDLTCLFGSTAFIRASSYAIDGQFWEASDTIEYYCSFFGEVLCADLQQRLQAIDIVAGDYDLTLLEWIDKSVHFNADPRHTSRQRYHGFSQERAHFFLQNSEIESVTSYSSKLLFVEDSIGKNLFQVEGSQVSPWPLASDEMLQSLDPGAGWVWTSNAQYLLARKNVLDAALSFRIAGPLEQVASYNNKVLLSDGQMGRILQIENGQIVELQALYLSDFYPLDHGFFIGSHEKEFDTLIDLEATRAIRLPNPNAFIRQVLRLGDRYLLKSQELGMGRYICQFMDAQGNVANLHQEGSCLNYSPSQNLAAIDVAGRIHLRTFSNGGLVRDEDVGRREDVVGENFIRTQSEVGARYFCFGASEFSELSLPSDAIDIAGCNERFVIEAGSGEWRVRERRTSQIVQRAQAYLAFASQDPMEHFVVGVNGSKFALFDLNRPERFSLMTDHFIWQPFVPYDRGSGLIISKGAKHIWLSPGP